MGVRFYKKEITLGEMDTYLIKRGNCEQFFKIALDYNKIEAREFQRSMFLARAEGDNTTWSPGKWKSQYQVYSKYPEEYKTAKRRCGNLTPYEYILELLG